MNREVHESLGREEQYSYLARVIVGKFGTGTGSEVLGLDAPERGTFSPVWMSYHRLNTLPGWPRALFHIVAKMPKVVP